MLWAAQELHARGWGQMYDGPVEGWRGWAYVALCVLVIDVLHDAWFYWTHRLLHWRPLMRRVHYMHHQSSVPSAYTGYSFHWAEAALVFANEVLVTFLFPVHAGLHRAYHLFATVIHNGGHCGYELAPFIPTLVGTLLLLAGRGRRHPGLNTVLHHDLHHRFPRGHFSLYFTHWDRWMGTMHRDYDAMADAVHRRGGAGAGAAAAGAAAAGAAAAGGGASPSGSGTGEPAAPAAPRGASRGRGRGAAESRSGQEPRRSASRPRAASPARGGKSTSAGAAPRRSARLQGGGAATPAP